MGTGSSRSNSDFGAAVHRRMIDEVMIDIAATTFGSVHAMDWRLQIELAVDFLFLCLFQCEANFISRDDEHTVLIRFKYPIVRTGPKSGYIRGPVRYIQHHQRLAKFHSSFSHHLCPFLPFRARCRQLMESPRHREFLGRAVDSPTVIALIRVLHAWHGARDFSRLRASWRVDGAVGAAH